MIVEELTEWELGSYWSGRTWRWVQEHRRGEWDLYIRCPSQIDFISETLDRLAARMRLGLETALGAARFGPERPLALVSHADPLKALLLSLRGEELDRLHSIEMPLGSAVLLELDLDGDSVSRAEIIGRTPITQT